MESITSDAHTHVEPGPPSVMPVTRPAPLHVHWGRTFFAVVGLLALLTAAISGALTVFHMGSTALSWAGLVLFAAVLAGLRSLAVRDQNLRLTAARRAAAAAATAAANAAAAAQSAGARRETTLFDGAVGAEPAPVPKPLTAEELRNAALRVAAKGTADAKLAHTQTLAEGELDGETWEPVEVPRPGYVTAAKAAAAAAAPLAIPAVPKSAGTSIRADQAGIGAAPAGAAPVEDSETSAASPSAAAAAGPGPDRAGGVARGAGKAPHALSNLDDVLQRRRA
ncbi:hypothetical protein [Specibacter sp. RAF43]|uniref:hypothetical protein n=1 Tax=Specibacter sp. RAF43 TaxID=3233057 RepID=UPI003F94927E